MMPFGIEPSICSFLIWLFLLGLKPGKRQRCSTLNVAEKPIGFKNEAFLNC